MITSINNKDIIETTKLKQKKYRDQTETFLIEGYKLVNEAIKSKAEIIKIYGLPDSLNKFDLLKVNTKIIPINSKVLSKLSFQKNPEGIIAVIKKLSNKELNNSKLLFLDNIRDPGNLGTIIRTADAAGFNSIYCSKKCADLYNEKTIRATMGSIFHIPIFLEVNLEDQIRDFKKEGIKIIGTSLNGNTLFLNNVDIPEKFALILGSESHGINQKILDLCNYSYKLPIFGKAESLNVAVAAGIFMYAFSDQKST